MIAHILKQADNDCTAFLGGISKNYESNLLLSEKSDCVVVEADEFDRSFLFLTPAIAVITSMDADHLDIYGNKEELIRSFNEFIHRIRSGGTLFYKKRLQLELSGKEKFKCFTYAVDEDADFKAVNIRVVYNTHYFDIITPDGIMENLTLGVPGRVNIENITAAVAVASHLGVPPPVLRGALASFSGVRRRFDYHINLQDLVYIDDYAHHPEELKAIISSVKALYKGRKITGIFQPHLFSRTRDLADAFAESLELLDELFLLDIYPAREQPIEGVTSSLIFNKVNLKHKTLCSKDEVINFIMDAKVDVLLTLGAGDIDTLPVYLTKMLLARKEMNKRMENED
jgi:UDP-N-acetylmuramate--alanine ligase